MEADVEADVEGNPAPGLHRAWRIRTETEKHRDRRSRFEAMTSRIMQEVVSRAR